MTSSTSTGIIGTLIIGAAVVSAGIGGYAIRTPTTIVEGRVTPDDAGGFVFVAVAGSASALDASTPTPIDAGTVLADASVIDAGIAPSDAGTPRIDAGSLPVDAGTVAVADAGVVVVPPNWGISIGLYQPPSTATQPAGAQLTVAALTEPSVGASTMDSQFPNVKATRLLPTSFVEYSQLRALSDDSTLLLVNDGTPNSLHRVYRFPSMVEVPIAAAMAGSWTAPRWRPTTHQVIYYLGAPARIAVYDIDTGTQTILATTPYQFASGSATWEQPSEDGQWAAIYTYPDNLPTHAGSTRILTAMNLTTGQPGAVLNMHTLYTTVCAPTAYGEDDYDWSTVSPNGKYLVVGWVRDSTARCSGLELFDVKTGAFVRQIYTGHNHGSLAVAPDGSEIYVTSVSASPLNSNFPSFVMYPLDGSAPHFPRMFAEQVNGSAFDHISCLAPGKPYCLVSGGGSMSGGPLPQEIGEIYLLNYVDGSLIRLFHARAGGSGGGIDTYFHQSHANISRDGHFATWTSDWNGANVAPFLIQLW